MYSDFHFQNELNKMQENYPVLKTCFGLTLSLVKNPLLVATIFNDKRTVEKLLKEHPVDPLEVDEPSPLQVAAAMGHQELVEFFLQKGANPNKTSYGGVTALMLAIKANKLNIVKLLLNLENIDVNIFNRGNSALAMSVDLEWCEISSLLINSSKFNLSKYHFTYRPFFEFNEIFTLVGKKDNKFLSELLQRDDFPFAEKTYSVFGGYNSSLVAHRNYQKVSLGTTIWTSPCDYAEFLGDIALRDQIRSEESKRRAEAENLMQTYFEVGKELNRESESNFLFFSYGSLQKLVVGYTSYNISENTVEKAYKKVNQ